MSRISSRLLSGVVLALLAGCGGSVPNGDGDGEAELVAAGEDFLAILCFPSVDGLLRCDEQPILAEGNAEETAAVIARALIAGPAAFESETEGDPSEMSGESFRALPGGVRLLSLELLDGVAYVDLTTDRAGSQADGTASAAGRSALRLERPPMGLREELVAVYSLVNTLTANNLGVDRVVLMWNGEQRPTFAGHVDTSRALMADLERNAAPSGGV